MKNTRFEGSTPGPWSANGDIGIVENKPGRAGFQIAAVSPIPGGREGNLSLIAAAPTLLERGQDAPPWLADAAEALGRVRPSDGAPLALNWNQVLQEIRDLRDERDGWKANCESWRMVYNAWQDWANDLLDDLGRQPLHGSHGDGPAREVIAQLAGMAAGVPRCSRCGCFSTRHEVDDEELRNCADCECTAFEAAQ